MLRKVSHIIFSALLLVSTMGLTISKHYCGTEVVSIAINHDAQSCSDMMDGDCCHTESSFFQVDIDYSAPQISSAPDLVELDVLGFELFSETFLFEIENFQALNEYSHSPPPLKIQTLFSLEQSYLL